MALVKRDPFAREELHRERVYPAYQGCSWCGEIKRTPTTRTYLYRYWIETDGGRRFDQLGRFCSESCRKAYQG